MIDDFKPLPPKKPAKKPAELTGFPKKLQPDEHTTKMLEESSLDDLLAPKATPDKPVAEASEPITKPKRPLKKIILLVVIGLIVLGGAGSAAWWFGFRDSGNPVVQKQLPAVKATATAAATPVTAVASLSGLDIDPAIATRPVTAIMIENSGEARPQAGIIDADIVFEAIAEGGITRYVALFQSKQPDYIGPIRSARPYYVEWAKTFDATYIHAGGSPDGLARVTALNVKDLSAFSDSNVFFRISSRYAPHNLYSSTKGIDQLEKDHGFTTSKFTPWPRKVDVPQPVTAKTINLNISSEFYNVSYSYDSVSNSYLRSLAGEAHKDDKSGKQISPKVVMVLVTDRSQDGIYSVYRTTGSGKLYIFQDGIASVGSWSKASATDQFVFTDSNGYQMKLNKGQTWVSVVAADSDVTYAP